NSRLVELNYVCITFNQIAIVIFGNGLFCLKDSVKNFALMIDFALGRIQIFCCFFVIGKNPTTKTQNPTRHTMNWEHYPTLESVEFLIFFYNGESGFLEKF